MSYWLTSPNFRKSPFHPQLLPTISYAIINTIFGFASSAAFSWYNFYHTHPQNLLSFDKNTIFQLSEQKITPFHQQLLPTISYTYINSIFGFAYSAASHWYTFQHLHPHILTFFDQNTIFQLSRWKFSLNLGAQSGDLNLVSRDISLNNSFLN